MNGVTAVLPEWLGRRAYLTPDVPALVAAAGTWTFRQLNAAADNAANSLSALLEAPTDAAAGRVVGGAGGENRPPCGPRVALLMGNTPEFVIWVHGIAKAGAVLVPLNTRLAVQELVWQLRDAGAIALVHDAGHAHVARAATRDLPHIRLIAGAAVLDGSCTHPDSFPDSGAAGPTRGDVRPDDLHSIVYTSGTTGRAKGAMLTYGNYWSNAMASALNLGVVPGDRWLACMPLFHVGGLSILLRSVIYGMTIIVHESFDPEVVNAAVDDQGVTLISVVAVMLERMLDARAGRPYPETLRAVLLGGGPAPRPLLQRAATAGAPVLQTYGLTEAASQVATLAPDDALRKFGSAGKPLFPVRLRIVPIDESPEDDVRPGRVGEIAVSGPTVSPGYWNKPTETAAVWRDGWIHTGDLGFLDEAGYLYVVDRREDLIVSGGENVYPAEIEAVLLEHADIEAAAVVGLADARWGRVPAAVIVAREGGSLTEAEVQGYCRQRLAAYKVPTRVVFETELPRNAAGKLLRRQLRERLEHAAPGR